MKKVVKFLSESNRWKHLLGGFVIGLLSDDNYCAALAGISAAGCLELKDKLYGGKWDWIDFSVTIAGTALGRLLRIVL